MLKNIIDLLNSYEFYFGDEDVDFAKGSNKVPESLKHAKQLIKRRRHGNK